MAPEIITVELVFDEQSLIALPFCIADTGNLSISGDGRIVWFEIQFSGQKQNAGVDAKVSQKSISLNSSMNRSSDNDFWFSDS